MENNQINKFDNHFTEYRRHLQTFMENVGDLSMKQMRRVLEKVVGFPFVEALDETKLSVKEGLVYENAVNCKIQYGNMLIAELIEKSKEKPKKKVTKKKIKKKTKKVTKK